MKRNGYEQRREEKERGCQVKEDHDEVHWGPLRLVIGCSNMMTDLKLIVYFFFFRAVLLDRGISRPRFVEGPLGSCLRQ